MALAQIAQRELDALRGEGIEPTDAEIVWLNDLGRVVENVALLVDGARGCPVRVGDVVLWPLTIQAVEWFDGQVLRHFTDDLFHVYALGFGMQFGRSEWLPDYARAESFAHLLGYEANRAAVNEWAKRLPITVRELQAGIAAVINAEDAPHAIKRPTGWDDKGMPESDIVCELVTATGLQAEYWRRHAHGEAAQALRSVYRRLAMTQGVDPKQATAPEREANHQFMSAADAIRKARQSNGKE